MEELTFRVRGHHLPLIHEFYLEQDNQFFYYPMGSHGIEFCRKIEEIAENVVAGKGIVEVVETFDDLCDANCKGRWGCEYPPEDEYILVSLDQKYLSRYGIELELNEETGERSKKIPSSELMKMLTEKELDYYRNKNPTIPNRKRRAENPLMSEL